MFHLDMMREKPEFGLADEIVVYLSTYNPQLFFRICKHAFNPL